MRNQIKDLRTKELLLNNCEPITYKEAMVGTDSIKWLKSHEILNSAHIKFLNLVDHLEG